MSAPSACGTHRGRYNLPFPAAQACPTAVSPPPLKLCLLLAVCHAAGVSGETGNALNSIGVFPFSLCNRTSIHLSLINTAPVSLDHLRPDHPQLPDRPLKAAPRSGFAYTSAR